MFQRCVEITFENPLVFFCEESWTRGHGFFFQFMDNLELHSEVFGGFIHMVFCHCLPPKKMESNLDQFGVKLFQNPSVQLPTQIGSKEMFHQIFLKDNLF